MGVSVTIGTITGPVDGVVDTPMGNIGPIRFVSGMRYDQ